MQLSKFTGPGSTPTRRAFWDKARSEVITAQKIEGKNVSVDERVGGTVINATRERGADCGDCVCIDSIEIVTAGSGYRVGEALVPGFGTICPPGGDFTFRLLVTGVNGSGAVTDTVIIPGMGYLTPPSNPVNFGASVLGSGFTANCTFACTSGTKPMPASIQIEFTGITFDCGCIDEGTTSRIYADEDFNDNPDPDWELTSSCGGAGVWRNLTGFDYNPWHTSVTYWPDNDTCSGSPDPSSPFTEATGAHFFLKDDVYRLVVVAPWGGGGTQKIFDGTTTNLALPIANTVSCGLAHGGTATITIL